MAIARARVDPHRISIDMTPLLKTLIVVVLTIIAMFAVVLAYAATLPDEFRVQRSTSIKAPAEAIFPLINDLRTMNSWNPFDKQDPDIKGKYSGPQSGRGASYAFDGVKAGTGRIEIVDVVPQSKVTMRLTMTRPMEADNQVAFTLEPQGGETRVTWAINGACPFICKVMHLFFNMDRMVGGEFEKGLANLKRMTEV